MSDTTATPGDKALMDNPLGNTPHTPPKPDKQKSARGPLYVRLCKNLDLLGLNWFIPLIKLAAGENPAAQIREMWMIIGIPVLAFGLFLALWGATAPQIQTSLGAVPGPAALLLGRIQRAADHAPLDGAPLRRIGAAPLQEHLQLALLLRRALADQHDVRHG